MPVPGYTASQGASESRGYMTPHLLDQAGSHSRGMIDTCGQQFSVTGLPCLLEDLQPHPWSPYVCAVLSRSVVSDSATPWTVACQALLSMEFSRQEHWSGLSFPPAGDLPKPGTETLKLQSKDNKD